ncbi:MAG: hypothetical protein LUQ50_03345 [Methanospirillum sp.]|uniref:hypothetical protein n=1 Tax=Methanospirillum sp. TaxID=45200 RepID=UPI00236E7282|nr:hypothetical protein [Methanospirillum sp.]MDD1728090.1 hypothetical protein [Methanospirillum sp.]
MNQNIIIVSSLGILLTALAWLFIEPIAAGMVLIIVLTIILGMAISNDAARHMHPEIIAQLSEGADTVIVENIGTAPAKSVQVRIIPEDIRYDIGDLDTDSAHRHQLSTMVREAKAAVSWEKQDGTRTEKIFRLSGYADESDPLKPIFPLFGWKEK